MNPKEWLARLHTLAIKKVCELYSISPVPTITELVARGEEGIEGEGGRIYASSWNVLEKAPEFEMLSEAVDALTKAVERAYFFAEDKGEKPIIDFKTESIIDIRLELTEEVSYRVRIYSPVTPKRVLNLEARTSPLHSVVHEGYESQLSAPELTIPQTGEGYLICIQKESEPSGRGSGTRDETKTFLVVRPGMDKPNMEIQELQRLVNAVIAGLEEDEEARAKVTNIKCKFRAAAEVTLTPGPGQEHPERYCYLAIDHNLLTIEADEIPERLRHDENAIALERIFREIQLRRMQIEDGELTETSIETEIEVNEESRLAVGDSGADDVMDFVYPD